jgi:hypothetical protein
VENVGRSANWIWACWMNVASNNAFNTYSALSGAGSAPPTTTHGIPFSWLTAHGITNTTDSVETEDPDGDRADNLNEFFAGTDPTNSASFLGLTAFSNLPLPGATGTVVRWSSVAGKYYRLDRGTNLLISPMFDFNVRSNIPATAPMNTETDANATGSGPYFYRIGVQ